MSRKLLALLVLIFFLPAVPAQAQFLKKLEQELLQGQQGQTTGQTMPGQAGAPQAAGNTNLPPGQYMMTNMQTGQGFYVVVQGNGQMFVTVPPSGPQTMMQAAPQTVAPGQPQQTGGLGGFMKNQMGNFLRNELSPAPQQQSQY